MINSIFKRNFEVMLSIIPLEYTKLSNSIKNKKNNSEALFPIACMQILHRIIFEKQKLALFKKGSGDDLKFCHIDQKITLASTF